MDLYHVMNRSVEGKELFLDNADFARFVRDLYEFNDPHLSDTRRRARGREHEIVVIHAWCLMKNHYHLLLSEKVPGGLNLFTRKLNVGYAKYFNKRYERRGFVFGGKTKKVLVTRHAHALYILHYIHLNPLDYLPGASDWRQRTKGEIRNATSALRFLERYKWSSYLDYIGRHNFPSILTRNEFRDEKQTYHSEIFEYLRDREMAPTDIRCRLGIG